VPAWVIVYCKGRAAPVTAAALLAAVRGADILTFAESYGVEEHEAAIRDTLARLDAEDWEGGADWDEIELFVEPDDWSRPIQAHRHTDPEYVAEAVGEEREWLEDDDSPGAAAVRAYLDGVREEVAFEMALGQVWNLPGLIASIAAAHVARVADGLIRHEDHTWWRIAPSGAWERIHNVTREGAPCLKLLFRFRRYHRRREGACRPCAYC
jgi:hypothetical protein